MNDKCYHCGASYGLHQSETELCPVGGVEETRPGYKQQWASTFFIEHNTKKVELAAFDLLRACQQLIDAPHQEHFAARLNDEEMKGIDAIKAAIDKALN